MPFTLYICQVEWLIDRLSKMQPEAGAKAVTEAGAGGGGDGPEEEGATGGQALTTDS